MKKLIVSIVEPVGGHGGNEFYDFGLCEHLHLLDTDVTLYTCDETTLDEKYSCSFKVNKVYKKIYGNDNKLIRGIRYLKGSLLAAINSLHRKVQIVHFHVYHFSSLELFNLLLFRTIGIKCIATIHDVESFDKYGTDQESSIGFKTKIILSLTQKLIVHSKLAKETLINIGAKEFKIHHVPHGDTDFIYNKNKLLQKEARKKLSLNPEGLVLLFFGQIKAVKGLDVLLKAIPKVDQSIQLLIVGKCWKQDLDDYLEIVEQLDIGSRVQFVNSYIENEEVPLYFWASDFACLPYKKIYSSGVVLRAMDYESAIISSDLEPLKAVIENQVNGLLFKSEDSQDLAEKINLLAFDEELRKELKVNAKCFIDEKYSWNIVANATLKVYTQLTYGE